MMAAELSHYFFAKLRLNDLQDCYETQWSVKLPYGNVHTVRNLCLNKNCRNNDGWNFGIFQHNLI